MCKFSESNQPDPVRSVFEIGSFADNTTKNILLNKYSQFNKKFQIETYWE